MEDKRIIFDEPLLSKFQLSYFGREAELNRLSLYDASASFYGFSRTVAILGHYYSTGKINAHAPRSEVEVFLEAAEQGSYKQTIIAAAISAVVSVPLTIFITRAIDNWIPQEDAQTQQIIDLLTEQNRLLRGDVPRDDEREFVEKADEFIAENRDQIDVLRSVTANSFKDIFRPVGRSADFVGISRFDSDDPIGAVNQRALSLIQADRPDDDVIVIVGVVNSFSRSSKTGVMFSREIGRGFRFEYKLPGRVPAEDDFSWSQYYQRPIRVRGRFVKFYDGKIKKLIVYEAERLSERELVELRDYMPS